MAGNTYNWIGVSGTAFAGSDTAEWSLAGVSPSGPPNQGDSAIVNQGTIILLDAGLQSSTIYLGGGELDFYGDAATTSGFNNTGTNGVSNPTVDPNSVITTDAGLAETVSGTAQTATIGAFGNFVNEGTIDAAGPSGSALTITVAGTTINGTFYSGTLTNDGQIDVEAGNTLVIALAGTSELVNNGQFNVSGGYLDINAGPSGAVSDPGFNFAMVNLGGGGTVEINGTYSGGIAAFVNFADSSPGNTLKIDNIGSFDGSIFGFGHNDTIDLGTSLAVGSLVYDQNTGLLELEQAGSIVATLNIPNTNFGSGTFALTGSIGPASTATADGLGLTLGNDGDIQLFSVPVTYTYIGDPGTAFSGNGSTNGLFSPNGSPQPGDSVIFDNGGTFLLSDASLQSNTIYLGSGTLAFYGDSGTTAGFNNINNNNNGNSGPTLDQNSAITTDVAAAETTPGSPQTATLDLFGNFINEGSIVASDVAGSSLSLVIAGTTIAGTINGTVTSTYFPGYAINHGRIEVDTGNSMTISIAAGAELFNTGEIVANGGSLFINGAAGAIAGGFAPAIGAAEILSGGTLETNASYAANAGGAVPIYAFADSTAGNTLKIDNIGSFGGRILGFGQHDTIDVGTSLAVGTVVYSSTTGLLNLENAGGTILASLLTGSGNFSSGTFAVAGGTAGSFNIATGTDGDTQITTGVTNDVYANASGTWQTAANWSNGQPGTLDTAFIGLGTKTPFILTTGSTPVSVGQITMASDRATLQITSNTTVGPNPLIEFGGTLQVTSGNTLSAADLLMPGGNLVIDPTAVFAIAGHVATGIGSVGGTLTISNGNTLALIDSGGTVLVNGGTINAAPSVSGGGGRIDIGVDGSGTPAMVTVQNSGTNAGKVTDTYTQLSSDPTSFGVLVLNGNVAWTDTIDPHDTVTSTGRMLVGTNNEAANSGTITPPAFVNAATLLVENAATLTDQNFAQIGATIDSAGAATVQTGGIWNIGTGGLGVGFNGTGGLSVLSAGTVAVGIGGISIGTSLVSASGTVLVSDANSLLSTTSGITVGRSGQGLMQILDGGTIALTGTSGITAGLSAGSSGTITVGGTDLNTGATALLNFGTTAKGITVGNAGQGTLAVSSGGTIQMSGTGGILIGQSLGASGVITVSGSGASINMANTGIATGGISIGQAGTGTLQVINGGGVTIGANGLNIGTASTGHGMVTVSGVGSTIKTLGTTGNINVGLAGTGVLNIDAGGLVSTAIMSINNGAVVVNGGTLSSNSSAGLFNVGATGAQGSVLIENAGTVTAANGFIIGSGGSGALTIQTGGLLSNTGTNTFAIAPFNGGSGTVVVDGGSLVTNGGLQIGSTNASASLLVENNGQLITNNTTIFSVINSTGTGTASAIVSGGTWTSSTGIIVGNSGTGSLTINSDGAGVGLVNAGTSLVSIGAQGGGGGTVSVTAGTLIAGNISMASDFNGNATGSLTIGNGGSVAAASINEGGGGTITVNGGHLSTTNGFVVGQNGTTAAFLTIGNNGAVTQTGISGFNIGGFSAGTNGTVTVNAGTLSSTGGGFSVGASNAVASLTVNSGGTLITGGGALFAFADINATGTGIATAAIDGGTWDSLGQILVGNDGTGSLSVINGGVINAGTNTISIGNLGSGSGAVIVGGNGATVDAGALNIASFGTTASTLTINAGGTVAISGSAPPGGPGPIPGFSSGLSIGGFGTLSMAGGVLSASGLAQNNGLIQGFGILNADLNNNGTIAASGGRLDITLGQTGTGTDTIGNGATLEEGASVGFGQSVSFVNGATSSALQLDQLFSQTQSFSLSDWQNGDELILANGVIINSADWSNGGTLAVFTTGGEYDFTNVTLAAGTLPIFATGSNFVELISCYAAGTMIETSRGEVPVEALCEGDLLPACIVGEMAPIIWIGRRDVDCRTHPNPRAVWPVRIAAGAFGDNMPVRDLYLSPDHAVYVDQVLVPVKRLINGHSIVQVPRDRVTYYHLELPWHDVIRAEGMPAESYLDVGDRGNFANNDGVVRLYADFGDIWETRGAAPLVLTGSQLHSIRERLEQRGRTIEARAA
jgi:T5SS/PEP-CTERM-associated repeat protein